MKRPKMNKNSSSRYLQIKWSYQIWLANITEVGIKTEHKILDRDDRNKSYLTFISTK